MGFHAKAILSICMLAGVALPEHGRARAPDEQPTAINRPSGSRATLPSLDIRRERREGLHIDSTEADSEPPGRERPDAFWRAFYGSVSNAMFGAQERRQRSRRSPRSLAPPQDAIAQLDALCRKQAQDLRNWPIDAVAEQVRPTPEQQRALATLRAAIEQESNRLATACGAPIPVGVLQRFERVQQRLQAMLQGVETLRPMLRHWVEGLDAGQRERFAQIGAHGGNRNIIAQRQATATCRALIGRDRVHAFARPLLRASKPRAAQRSAMNEVMMAALRGHQLLYESCALERSGDPLNRLEVMRQRLQMSADAVDGLRSALEDFYVTLDERQKRRFVRLGYGQRDTRASLRP